MHQHDMHIRGIDWEVAGTYITADCRLLNYMPSLSSEIGGQYLICSVKTFAMLVGAATNSERKTFVSHVSALSWSGCKLRPINAAESRITDRPKPMDTYPMISLPPKRRAAVLHPPYP